MWLRIEQLGWLLDWDSECCLWSEKSRQRYALLSWSHTWPCSQPVSAIQQSWVHKKWNGSGRMRPRQTAIKPDEERDWLLCRDVLIVSVLCHSYDDITKTFQLCVPKDTLIHSALIYSTPAVCFRLSTHAEYCSRGAGMSLELRWSARSTRVQVHRCSDNNKGRAIN